MSHRFRSGSFVALSSSFSPPYLDDSSLLFGGPQGETQTLSEPVWNVRKNAEEKRQESRVRFLRMPGTRLSPRPSLLTAAAQSYGDSCPSEAYFGDCSRDSSLERGGTSVGHHPAATTTVKGRLYERGGCVGEPAVNQVLDSAFKSFCQFHEDPQQPVAEQEENIAPRVVESSDARPPPEPDNNWEKTDWSRQQPSDGNGESSGSIWAPLESDWALLGPESLLMPWPSTQFASKVPTDAAVQLSLALLNHHPERSGFSPVMATKSLALPKSSKLMEWLAQLASGGTGGGQQQQQQLDPALPDSAVDGDEEEVESILKEPEPLTMPNEEDEEEQENLLTSPKTHFCPIQQEGDVEVQVKIRQQQTYFKLRF